MWRPAVSWQDNWQEEIYNDLDQELNLRKIRHSDQMDKIRWGYTPRGMFTTKEAYRLLYQPEQPFKDQIWDQIWQPLIWPKVSIFLWLLSKQRILTWDSLQKRGFIGPSKCPNCNLQAETTTHLLDSCPLANNLWKRMEKCNRRTSRRVGDIVNTIRNWPNNPFQCLFLNTLWKLLPGFIYWILWKERNSRIFRNHSSLLDTLWNQLKQNLQETLALRK